jgi:5-formyltetrahydrofolate cyclo-ligase
MADEKKYWRTMLGESRASLTREFARTSSTAIQRRLLDTSWYRAARAIVLYSPIQNEVATAMAAADAFSSGKEVFYPRIDPAGGTLEAAHVRDVSELRPGAFGITEPPLDAEIVAPAKLAGAIICVPGVAFGLKGQRLGRGGGHYDRFLAALPDEAITVGLAYSFQLLDRIPEESFDQRLKCIITESACIRVSELIAHGAEPGAGRGGTPGWVS